MAGRARIEASDRQGVRRRRLLVATFAFPALAGSACGGTTGREGLTPPQGLVDATVTADAGMDAAMLVADSGSFDVTIQYADQELPDVSPPMESGTMMAPPDTGGLDPCTTSGQTGCVSCTGSTGGVCTADEAFYVLKDIIQGVVTAPIAPTDTYPASSCYACLLTNGCIDSRSHHVSGVECSDLTGNFTDGLGETATAASTCFTLVKDLLDGTKNSCLFGEAANGSSVGNDTFCYCGTGGYGPAGPNQGLANCKQAAPLALNGTDVADESAGFSSTVPNTNLGNYNSDFGPGSGNEPSAVANDLAECARGNGASVTSIATSTCPLCLK
jgi:hypothetical protein